MRFAGKLVACQFDLQESGPSRRPAHTNFQVNQTQRTVATNRIHSRALLRPMEAEVLLDAVCQVTGWEIR